MIFDYESKKPTKQEPYIQAPFSDNFKNCQFIPIEYLKLWPVLAVHASRKNDYICFPSIKRLAYLSHMREANVKPTMTKFAMASDALTIWKEENGKIKYKLETPRIKDKSFPIGSNIILNALWAGLPDSRIIVYCALMAFAINPEYELGKNAIHKDKNLGIIESHNMRFLSRKNYDEVYNYCCSLFEDPKIEMSEITFRRSLRDLLEKKFILIRDREIETQKGFILPYHVPGKNQKVLDKLEKLKEQSISRRAKVSFTALKKRDEPMR